MAAFLVPVGPGLCVIPLEKAVVLIGRQADCDVSLTQSRKVSRRHCCLAQVNNQIFARDLGSTNGIYLNGERVKKQCRLSLGDEFMIGDLRFRLQNDPNPARAATPDLSPNQNAVATPSSKPTPFVRGVPGGELPSLEVPVALPEEGREFAIEPSVPKFSMPLRYPRHEDNSGPLVPFVPSEPEDSESDVIPLGSDSGI
jgi:predicted component of type VI protein secretion system